LPSAEADDSLRLGYDVLPFQGQQLATVEYGGLAATICNPFEDRWRTDCKSVLRRSYEAADSPALRSFVLALVSVGPMLFSAMPVACEISR